MKPPGFPLIVALLAGVATLGLVGEHALHDRWRNFSDVHCIAAPTKPEPVTIAGRVFDKQTSDIVSFNYVNLTDSDIDNLLALKGLRALQLWGGSISATQLGKLAASSHLVSLDLTGVPLNDASFKAISQFASLQNLDLVVSPRSLPHPDANSGLKEIAQDAPTSAQPTAGSDEWSNVGLAYLSNMPALSDLTLVGDQFSDNSIAALNSPPALQKLSIFSDAVTDSSIPHISTMKRLTSLTIRSSALTGANLELLQPLPQLESLSLGQSALTDDGLKGIAKISSLQNLRLSSVPAITDVGVAQLKSLRYLSDIDLSYTKATATGLADFPSLTRIDLAGTPTDDASLAALAGSSYLRSVSLAYTAIDGSGLINLQNSARTLDSLNLAGTKVTGNAFKDFGKLAALWSLHLENSAVTDQQMVDIAQSPNLHWLGLNDTSVGDEGVARLATNWHLMSLNLNRTKVTDAGLRSLENLPRLRDVEAADTAVTRGELLAFNRPKPDCAAPGKD